ncbi:hypothetical protein LTR85_005892 [Meristemomyces frigidus]|nr:hypothetical protein LTR85_005892 [Meristemomyces frigidus]
MTSALETVTVLLAAYSAVAGAFPPPESVKGFFDSAYTTSTVDPEPTTAISQTLITPNMETTTTPIGYPSPTAPTLETLVAHNMIVGTGRATQAQGARVAQ